MRHAQDLQALGREVRVEASRESFRFGDGTRLQFRHAMMFEASIAGRTGLLRFSVVPGNGSPLLSRPAGSELGPRIDCERHCVDFRRPGVVGWPATPEEGGHYKLG
eukprot:7771440-Lingulodinium_polyedra.AAC.1